MSTASVLDASTKAQPTHVVYATRAEWLLSRRKGMGASEVAAILGLNPYRSAFEVWTEKVDQAPAVDRDLGEHARWGVLLEDAVRVEAARRIGRRIFIPGASIFGKGESNAITSLYVTWTNPAIAEAGVPLFCTPDGQIDREYSFETSREAAPDGSPLICIGRRGTIFPSICLRPAGHLPWDLAHPERQPGHVFDLVDPRGPGLYEGKVAGLFVSREEWADEGPALHLIQIQAGLAVLGWKWGLLAGLIAGQRLVLHEVERDDAFIAWMLDSLRKFWQLVERREPPAVDGSDSARDALSSYYSRGISGKVVELPGMARLWADQYFSGKEQEKRGKASAQEAGNLLRAAIGDCEAGLLPGDREDGVSGFRWPTVEPASPTCPHCKAAIRETKPHRRLTAFKGAFQTGGTEGGERW